MKRFAVILLLFAAAMCFAAGKTPKYIFLFIGDGMATPQRMVADEFARKAGHGALSMNKLPFHSTTRTVSSNSLVTDSAAAGTAIACGSKTVNGRIGIDASGKVRLESVAELAQKRNFKVGIISTMVINHATPAAFYGHRLQRSQYYDLGVDLVNSGFDFFAGGGVRHHAGDPRKKKQLPDIYKLAAQKGYKVIDQKKSFDALKPGCGKVLYVAAPGYMTGVIDAPPTQSTLAEMTAKGIELLKNPKGFFMMVEGGTIDVYGHANDAPSNLREVLALDEAVRVALKFADAHPDETLIVITGDHETGGMTLGFAASGDAMHVENLLHQKCSAQAFRNILKEAEKKKKNFTFEDAKVLLTKYFGFKFSGRARAPMVLNKKQIALLENAFKKGRLYLAARQVTNQLAGIGWTTGAHTGVPVLTTASGVGGEIFSGYIDNTDIAKKLKSLIK